MTGREKSKEKNINSKIEEMNIPIPPLLPPSSQIHRE
jgi:hypothetical protein